jgi:hypothetical protein
MPLASTLTTVDRRVYDQVAASRTRLASSLSAANAQVRALKKHAAARDRALAKAAEVLTLAMRELKESAEDAEAAAAAAAHAVSPAERSKKAKLLAARLSTARREIEADFESAVDPFVPRRIPLVYLGMASDVKLVGSFDGWSAEGVRLSAVGASSSEDDSGGGDGGDGGIESSSSSFSNSAFSEGGTRFEGDAWLLPGRYLVKWVVDGDQYRLAPEWPTEEDANGSTNNVLIVE